MNSKLRFISLLLVSESKAIYADGNGHLAGWVDCGNTATHKGQGYGPALLCMGDTSEATAVCDDSGLFEFSI